MASKRDQLQAYQFMVQRVISAIVTRESDPETPPFRRPTITAVFSIVLAVVALGVVWIFGLLVPGGNKTWRDGDMVIVEKETGSQYVYLNGKLLPVSNYASGVLALGSHAETTSVSHESLMGVPRGPAIGIPNAPSALPQSDQILRKGWTLCSVPDKDDAGKDYDKSVLLVGHEPADGIRLGQDALILTQTGKGTKYLVWQGYKHPIKDEDAVLKGLAVLGQPPRYVGTELLDSLPTGETIKPLTVPGIGKKSTAVPSKDYIRTGEILRATTDGGGQQFYLAHKDRLRPISEMQAEIQLADERTAEKAYRDVEPVPTPIGPLDVPDEADMIKVRPPLDGSGPTRRPGFVDPGRGYLSVCATYDPGKSNPRLRVNPTLPGPQLMTPTTGTTQLGTPMADEVYVPPGWASVVEVVPSASMMAPADADSMPMVGTVLVVTDQGRAYALDEPKSLDILGYGGIVPLRLSDKVIARVPLGPGLSQQAALQAAEAPIAGS